MMTAISKSDLIFKMTEELNDSPSVLKFRVNGTLPLFLGFFMDELIVEDRYHFIGFGIGLPPSLFSTICAFVNRFSFILLFLIVFLHADVPVYPINLVLFAFISIAVSLLRLALCGHAVITNCTVSLQLSVLFLEGIDFTLQSSHFLAQCIVGSF
jgi:hypothetical protein